MHSDNLVNKFLKFLDPPKFIKLRPMESNFKGEKQDQGNLLRGIDKKTVRIWEILIYFLMFSSQ